MTSPFLGEGDVDIRCLIIAINPVLFKTVSTERREKREKKERKKERKKVLQFSHSCFPFLLLSLFKQNEQQLQQT